MDFISSLSFLLDKYPYFENNIQPDDDENAYNSAYAEMSPLVRFGRTFELLLASF